jgi:hypothetical protein
MHSRRQGEQTLTKAASFAALAQKHIYTTTNFFDYTCILSGSLYSRKSEDWQLNTMPQHHLSTGTVSYPDAKSSFPAFPKVGFGRAIAIGIGAGAVGACV